jgi:hypothetical protein
VDRTATTEAPGYSHTQKAPLSLFVYGAAIALFVGAWIARSEFPVPLILAGSGAAMCLLALAFHHLTVVDRGELLAIRFGPLPLFRRTVRYADIASVEVGRTLILEGWGIHYSIRGGWVWNLWGRRCVVVLLKNGGVLRVGTDDADNLAHFLEAQIAHERKRGGERTLTHWYTHIRQIPSQRLQNIIRAFHDASDRSSRPVELAAKPDDDDSPYDARLVTKPARRCIIIRVGANLSEYSVVHECLHVIVSEEGYPWGWFEYSPDLFPSDEFYRGVLGAISNTLHHALIYHRMGTCYGLEMEPYWKREIDKGIATINGWKPAPPPPGQPWPSRRPVRKQFDIVSILFNYLVPELQPVCERYKVFPWEHMVCEKLASAAAGLNLADKNDVARLARLMGDELAKYCKDNVRDHPLMPEYEKLWLNMAVGSLDQFPL